MIFAIKSIARFLRVLRKEEDGSESVVFALIFLPFIMIPVTGFELGLLMTRHVMVERGLTMAVREVSLNTIIEYDREEVKAMICNAAGIIPDCMDNLRLEMRNIDLRNPSENVTSAIPLTASCTDVGNPDEVLPTFDNGFSNELMIVRACGLFTPMLPEFGLGYFLSRMRSDGYYPLVTSTAFVMEPV